MRSGRGRLPWLLDRALLRADVNLRGPGWNRHRVGPVDRRVGALGGRSRRRWRRCRGLDRRHDRRHGRRGGRRCRRDRRRRRRRGRRHCRCDRRWRGGGRGRCRGGRRSRTWRRSRSWRHCRGRGRCRGGKRCRGRRRRRGRSGPCGRRRRHRGRLRHLRHRVKRIGPAGGGLRFGDRLGTTLADGRRGRPRGHGVLGRRFRRPDVRFLRNRALRGRDVCLNVTLGFGVRHDVLRTAGGRPRPLRRGGRDVRLRKGLARCRRHRLRPLRRRFHGHGLLGVGRLRRLGGGLGVGPLGVRILLHGKRRQRVGLGGCFYVLRAVVAHRWCYRNGPGPHRSRLVRGHGGSRFLRRRGFLRGAGF